MSLFFFQKKNRVCLKNKVENLSLVKKFFLGFEPMTFGNFWFEKSFSTVRKRREKAILILFPRMRTGIRAYVDCESLSS